MVKEMEICCPQATEGLRMKIGYGPFTDLVPLTSVKVEELRLRGHLPSTRGGAWGWRTTEEIKERHLSRAPYQPGVDMTLKNVILTVERNRQASEEATELLIRVHDDYYTISVEGTEKTEIESDRQRRTKDFNQLLEMLEETSDAPLRQGHLTVKRMIVKASELEEEVRKSEKWGYTFYVRGMHIYNHYVQRADGALRLDNRMLVFTSEKTMIVSPDHLEETIQLEPGVYLLEHPIPVDTVD